MPFQFESNRPSRWFRGNSNSTSPTVLLFNTTSNNPLFSYASPGSMFDIDVLGTRSGLRWLLSFDWC